MSLVAQHLSLFYDGVQYLDDASVSFGRGELTAVIGPMLAGKTTLMRVIAGLQNINSGEIFFDDKPFGILPTWKRDVAMVYQQFTNYPHLTVFKNVAFPLRKQGLKASTIERRVGEVLATVGLAEFSKRKPSELSGGQQQRVALARALVRQSGILLLDEPLFNLDYKLREQLREEFRGLLTTQENSVVIFNTAEPAEAMMIANRLIVMHEARVLQVGAPAEVFETPASTTVAGIINDPPMNFFPGCIDDGTLILGKNLRFSTPSRLAALPETSYQFGLRASEMMIAEEAPFNGRVTFSEVSGSDTELHITGDDGSIVLQLEGVYDMRHGSDVHVTIPLERLFVFGADDAGELISAPEPAGRNN